MGENSAFSTLFVVIGRSLPTYWTLCGCWYATYNCSETASSPPLTPLQTLEMPATNSYIVVLLPRGDHMTISPSRSPSPLQFPPLAPFHKTKKKTGPAGMESSIYWSGERRGSLSAPPHPPNIAQQACLRKDGQQKKGHPEEFSPQTARLRLLCPGVVVVQIHRISTASTT